MEADFLAAKSVARTPDHLLRTIDHSELQAGIFRRLNFQLYVKSRRDFIAGSWIAVSN